MNAVIVRAASGSTAEKAGIKAGERFSAVNGNEVRDVRIISIT
jgi:S1-C subfamily serine protease